jgi:hypothetical protein
MPQRYIYEKSVSVTRVRDLLVEILRRRKQISTDGGAQVRWPGGSKELAQVVRAKVS